MAQDDGPATVTLIDPTGNACNVSTAADVVNLVFGAGYKVKGFDNADAAVAFLADKGIQAPQGSVAEQQLIEGVQDEGSTKTAKAAAKAH